jgi:hypothetical protein
MYLTLFSLLSIAYLLYLVDAGIIATKRSPLQDSDKPDRDEEKETESGPILVSSLFGPTAKTQATGPRPFAAPLSPLSNSESHPPHVSSSPEPPQPSLQSPSPPLFIGKASQQKISLPINQPPLFTPPITRIPRFYSPYCPASLQQKNELDKSEVEVKTPPETMFRPVQGVFKPSPECTIASGTRAIESTPISAAYIQSPLSRAATEYRRKLVTLSEAWQQPTQPVRLITRASPPDRLVQGITTIEATDSGPDYESDSDDSGWVPRMFDELYRSETPSEPVTDVTSAATNPDFSAAPDLESDWDDSGWMLKLLDELNSSDLVLSVTATGTESTTLAAATPDSSAVPDSESDADDSDWMIRMFNELYMSDSSADSEPVDTESPAISSPERRGTWLPKRNLQLEHRPENYRYFPARYRIGMGL